MSEDPTPINEVVWDIHSTHPELVQPLRDKFSEVMDPEIGLNIVQLGLIRKVSIKEGKADIFMILTTPFCPYGPAMLETTRQKALEALNMDVNIELGMEPWDFSLMEDPGAIDWGMYT
ncbi:MAG TPA: FeS assembly SUF system protein [Anaerolineae bacterium]|nr:FeS assembly SUF system protein [Anaerolineae bacterium]HCM96719.1 FeS assembly SUF system protein [Anaerolineae bacterium]